MVSALIAKTPFCFIRSEIFLLAKTIFSATTQFVHQSAVNSIRTGWPFWRAVSISAAL